MTLAEILGRAGDLNVRRAFGDPIESGGTTIVPVAVVGGGGGGGEDVRPNSTSTENGSAARTSGGGGWGGVSYPLGVYVIKDGDVRFVPAWDLTRVVVAALALLRAVAKIKGNRRKTG